MRRSLILLAVLWYGSAAAEEVCGAELRGYDPRTRQGNGTPRDRPELTGPRFVDLSPGEV